MHAEKKQRATVAERGLQSNGKNLSHDKELMRAYSVVAPDPQAVGGMAEPVVARCWMARRADGAGVVYASVWLHGRGVYASGHGKARGYGYHKASAAIGAALQSAGVCLAHDIDGVGDAAIRDALEACARMMGYRGKLLTVEHA